MYHSKPLRRSGCGACNACNGFFRETYKGTPAANKDPLPRPYYYYYYLLL
jgi:hypothetical protein